MSLFHFSHPYRIIDLYPPTKLTIDAQSPAKASETPTSDVAESTPAVSPPSGSSFPSIEPSGSSLPSLEPSDAPSSYYAAPSGSTAVPVTEGSAVLSPSGSAFPSSTPSSEPSFVPTTTSVVAISAPISVSIPCRSEMDNTTVSAFETATLDFVTENLPDGSGITVISVTVVKQTLITAAGRLLRQRLLQESSELLIDMEIEGTQEIGSEGDVPVEDVIGTVLTDNSQAFQDKLGGVTSFFRGEFAYAASEENDGNASSAIRSQNGTTDNGLNIGLISGSIVAALAATVIAALLVVRYRKTRGNEEVRVDTRQIDLLSWSTASPTSFDPTGKDSNGFVPANAHSPTDSEVYEDDERYAASVQGRLSPIEEDTQSRLEDCDINTPRHEHTLSQATPQGTPFVQMDFKRSKESIKASKEKAGKILGDLEHMEGEWEGQLDSKVDAVAETPKQNNLEKFKVGSRVHQD